MIRAVKLGLFLVLILSLIPCLASAGILYYTGDSLPSAYGWQTYGASSNENGNNISSTVVSDGGSNVWMLTDNSTSYRCKEDNRELGDVSFNTGVTVAARIKCSSSSGSSYNLGISNGNVGAMCLAVETGQLTLMEFNGASHGTFSADATSYHIYYLTVKNSVQGNNNSAVWNVYRDGTLIITYTGAGTNDAEFNFDGFFAGHAGGSGTGAWYFDWISGRNDGAFSPAEWDASPPSPPAAPTVQAPSNGAAVNSHNPQIEWTGAAHDTYEVHLNTTNSATSANIWDSGQVSNSASYCVPGTISNGIGCYVFVRLHNVSGWGSWSAAGRWFTIDYRVRIIPEPQQFVWKAGTGFLVNSSTQIVMNTIPSDKDTFTADLLQRKVWDMTGYLPAIVQGGSGAPTTNVIAVGDPAKNTAVASIIASWPDATGKASKSEGYILGVKDTSIVIRGFDNPGTFYGCQTLIQLLETYGASRISPFFCYDYPDLPLRGMFFRVQSGCDWSFPKEVISEVMARYKMNVIEPALAGAMRWDSHPELPFSSPSRPVVKQDFIDLINYGRQYFVDVIPCSPSWNHSDEWLTAGTTNEALREDRTIPDDTWIEDLCPRNPTGQQLLRDLRNELYDMFHPAYMHVGESEYASLGASSCPRCGGTLQTTLFNEFLWNDYNYCSSKGMAPIMWGDMLRADMNGTKNGWNTYQCVATMPKGMVIQDWDYSTKTDFPSLQTWNDNGITSMAAPYGLGSGGYVGKENIYYWGKSARKYGVQGMVSFNKYVPDDKRNALNDSNETQNLACYPFVADWGWSPERPYWSPLPYDGNGAVFARLAPDVPTSLAASLLGGGVRLTWTNPTNFTYQPSSTFQGVWICYRTDRFPTSPIDGSYVADVNGAPGASRSFDHTTAPLGATIYYAAFSHDAIRHFSPSATAMVNNGSALNLGNLSATADGKGVNVAQGIVTAVYQNCFYVEDEKRINAIRVESTASVAEKDIVTIDGILGKTGAERSLVTVRSVTKTGQRTTALGPLGSVNSALGGANKGYVPGSGAIGVNNVGLLMRTFGQVRNAVPGSHFYLNDGSSAIGVKVVITGTKTGITIPAGSYFAVTGACSLDGAGKAIVWPRSQADIVVMQ